MSSSEAVLVFDLGGTSFRSGILAPDQTLVGVTKRAAINHKNSLGLPVSSLQERLLEYLLSETRRLREEFSDIHIVTASVSVGAAVNAHTGMILDSGPLWGPDSKPFDLQEALREREPGVDWTVVNDVSAALLYYANVYRHERLPKMSLITVSTGIGCRTYDSHTQSIPVDATHGIQGEIGHLPIAFEYKKTPVELYCDCGGMNHLNAFCSGRGIESLIRTLATRCSADPQLESLRRAIDRAPEQMRLQPFVAAVARGDSLAQEILDSVTRPLAEILRNLFTLDPEVERVVLVGGVVRALGESYRGSLLGNLEAAGLYQVSEVEPEFFRRRLRLGLPHDDAGLLGAALAAAGTIEGQAEPRLRCDATAGAHSWTVSARPAIRYAVRESNDLFSPDNVELLSGEQERSQSGKRRRRLVIIDECVDVLHGEWIRHYFRQHDIECRISPLKISERQKSIDALLDVIKELEEFGVPRRHEPIIAIGGGVLLDIVGMAASVYRRGVPYIRVPTTLLSLVDAGVGVKSGVNFSGSKNRLGSFYPAQSIFLDRRFLVTVDDRQIRSGVAEILKIAIIKDRALFELLENHGSVLVREKFQSADEARPVIRRAVHGMLDELSRDFLESQLYRRMDFGHSFGPAMEMKALPALLHGEAVALDMALSIVLANRRGLFGEACLIRSFDLMRALGLPLMNESFDPWFLYQALQETAVHRGGLQRLPLPTAIGSAEFVNDVTLTEISAAIDDLRMLA